MSLFPKNVLKYFSREERFGIRFIGGMMEAKSKEIEINDITPDTFNSKNEFSLSRNNGL